MFPLAVLRSAVMKRVVLLVLLSVGSSCDCGPEPVPDAGPPDAAIEDAGFYAGLPDAGQPDAGEQDAGADAGIEDAGFDAGPQDAGFDAGVTDAGTDLCPVPDGTGAPFRVRAMAANLTSGNFQTYTPGEGIRLMQGADPDIVMIQ